jgi:hypothetical protein
MATSIKVGDNVKIAAREQTPADVKSGLYYPHYANLRGTILKLYGEEASVLVDRETLPDAVRARHDEGEAAMRQRYLDGLSEEARNRMNAREKGFSLNYAVLVSLADVSLDKVGAAAAKKAADEAEAKRISSNDLDAAESAFLAQRKGGSGANGAGR